MMAVLHRKTAVSLFWLAAVLGGGALFAFLVFLFLGSPEIISLHLRPDQALAWDAVLCLAFFLQHSGMIRRSFRGRLSQIIRAEYSGAIFAVSSGAVLFAFILLWQKSGDTLVVSPTAARWSLRLTYLLSLAGFFWGTRALGHFDPFGLRPISLSLRGRKPEPMPFVVRGPYRWVRHPLYLFMLLMIWSCADLTSDRLLFNALWTIWILVGTRLEERDLIAEFGDTYRDYQDRVPMLIPRSIRPVEQVAGRK